MTIAIINGPNMDLLGVREPILYGNITLSDIQKQLEELAPNLNCSVTFYQSNYEGDIVEYIHAKMYEIDGIVLNPAGLSKTGYSILDAIEAIHIPFVEVHLTNIFDRGSIHDSTIFLQYAKGHVIGLKEFVYELGLRGILYYLRSKE